MKRPKEEQLALDEESARKAAYRERLVALAIPKLAEGLLLVDVARSLGVKASRLSRLLRKAGVTVPRPTSLLPHGLPVD